MNSQVSREEFDHLKGQLALQSEQLAELRLSRPCRDRFPSTSLRAGMSACGELVEPWCGS
jgi:hypothetical protein